MTKGTHINCLRKKHFGVDCGVQTPERTLFMWIALFFLGESHREHGDSSKFLCTIRSGITHGP